MKLHEYLERENISPQDFAKIMGVNYTTVWRWLNDDDAWPSKRKMIAIRDATDEAVQANDWVDG
jgi:transcriptional regulator with XRE-family HTH domain